MNTRQQINRLFLFATAPFLGMMIWLLSVQLSQLMPSIGTMNASVSNEFSISDAISSLDGKLTSAVKESASIKSTIESVFNIYTKSSADVSGMLKAAAAQAGKPAVIFDNRIAASLGKPVKQASTSNIDLKLYSFADKNYKAYAIKADLKSDQAMKMVLGKDKIGSGGETTLSAASRYGAIAGVNAGGFADDNSSRRYPTGTTMYNGKYVYGFFPTQEDLAFVGLNKEQKLIGGKFNQQDELDSLSPQFGATFVPVLLKSGIKQNIPDKWQTSPYRAPRTAIGTFKNDQMIVIVTDGFDERGGSGASLAELQDRLQQLGVKDAYNLDGGGSSTLVWGGEVINKPSDGKMRNLPTHFLFFK